MIILHWFVLERFGKESKKFSLSSLSRAANFITPGGKGEAWWTESAKHQGPEVQNYNAYNLCPPATAIAYLRDRYKAYVSYDEQLTSTD